MTTRFRLTWFAAPTLWATLPLALGGCMFLDDFGKYRVVDENADRDAASADAAADAGTDDAAPTDAGNDGGPECELDADCADRATDCAAFSCEAGECVAKAIHEGDTCILDPEDKCAVAACVAGECVGSPKDCTQYDSECTQGVCDPDTGACGAKNANEGDPCSDGLVCSVGDVCTSGVCTGTEMDCSSLDDDNACTMGICDEAAATCVETAAAVDTPCDDFDPCTTNDYCNAAGSCVSNDASLVTEPCNDYDDCTTGDHCDGAGQCIAGSAATDGTACDADQECTLNKTCSSGICGGGAKVADGTPCSAACRTADTCQNGVCTEIAGSEFFPSCQYNWCGDARLCESHFQSDGSCDCGCGFIDLDCTDCSMWMCERNWCDGTGSAIADCDTALMGDGLCDCGCQFDDPDCSGGDCCAPTGVAGCGDSYIENCLCAHANGDPFCCGQNSPSFDGTWDARCVALAQQLGCMACP